MSIGDSWRLSVVVCLDGELELKCPCIVNVGVLWFVSVFAADDCGV